VHRALPVLATNPLATRLDPRLFLSLLSARLTLYYKSTSSILQEPMRPRFANSRLVFVFSDPTPSQRGVILAADPRDSDNSESVLVSDTATILGAIFSSSHSADPRSKEGSRRKEDERRSRLELRQTRNFRSPGGRGELETERRRPLRTLRMCM
jgi:hypothetical protein